MKLMSLPPADDYEQFNEIRHLNKIMKDLNLGERLPEKALSYEQVLFSNTNGHFKSEKNSNATLAPL